jgi:DNA ligase 1
MAPKAKKTIENGPMLAVEAPADLCFPMYMSPKYDGIRAVGYGGSGMTRSMKPVPNQFVQNFFSESLEGLDGELIVGDPTAKDVYRRTSSGVMSEEGMPDFNFYVFDNWNAPEGRTFAERWDRLKIGLEMLPREVDHGRIIPVAHTLVTDYDQLVAYEEMQLEAGYEGVMGRSPNGVYKFGRSTQKEGYLLKFKQFVHGEAEIIGFQELMHNANEAFIGELGQTKRQTLQENLVPMGTLGALLVRDLVSGIEFGIGTGFTNEERDRLWSIRKDILRDSKRVFAKYKHFPIGVKDKPRFPVYEGLRYKADMS